MSAEERFQSRGFNKAMGLWTHDWHLVATVFTPFVCVRQLIVQDVASGFLMHHYAVPTKGTRARASDVIQVFEECFEPRVNP